MFPQPPVAATTHSQVNGTVMLDEVDTGGETTKYVHTQSFTGVQDHVINFHQSQSDPINRGLSI